MQAEIETTPLKKKNIFLFLHPNETSKQYPEK
jgi:hypothetical protein